MQGAGEQPGQRGADQQVVVGPLDLLLDPAELGVGHHRPVPGLQHPAAPGVDHQQPDVAEVAPVGPLGTLAPVGLLVGRRGELPQHRLAVLAGRPDPLVELELGQVGRREVAEVLVDPVRRQAADDPLLPPRGLLHLPPPQRRGVPVVAHVVVVEDHRGRDRRQQPADVGVAPAPRGRARCTPRSPAPARTARRWCPAGPGSSRGPRPRSRRRTPGRRAAAARPATARRAAGPSASRRCPARRRRSACRR